MVAPFAGACVETVMTIISCAFVMSLPSRERVLKQLVKRFFKLFLQSLPSRERVLKRLHRLNT